MSTSKRRVCAYVLYSPQSQYYYLFTSFGGLDAVGGYNVRIARSRNADGPYVDGAGTDMATVKGAVNTVFDDASITPHGMKLMGGHQFANATGEDELTSTLEFKDKGFFANGQRLQ